MEHAIEMFKACHSNFDVPLAGVQTKLFKQWSKLLARETGNPDHPDTQPWTEADTADYEERMERMTRLVEEAYSLGRRASTDGESYMEWYPLAVSTLLYERLLLRTCFEEPEYGGDVDMEAAPAAELLKKMGSRLGYVAGMHDVCYAVAVMEQFKLAKDSMQLELLQKTVEKCVAQHECLQIRCVQTQFKIIMQFCAEHLSDYHQVEDSSHIAHFAQSFVLLHCTLQNTQAMYAAEHGATVADGADGVGAEAGQLEAEDPETLLTGFIQTSMEKNYEVVRQRAAAASNQIEEDEGDMDMNGNMVIVTKQTPMQRLRVFVEMLQEEMDAELHEYAAYIGVYHPRAAVVAGQKMADLLNQDLVKVFRKVDKDDPEVMGTWTALRGLEAKIIEAMENCGVEQSDAKVLKLDECMSDVAIEWVDKQTAIFEERVRRALDDESWEPVSEDAYMSASAIDIMSMLTQVSRGYFSNELPVTEHVMKDLLRKFGHIIQRYCRLTLQQCGDKPEIKEKAISGGSSLLGGDSSSGSGTGVEGKLGAVSKLGGSMMQNMQAQAARQLAIAKGESLAEHDDALREAMFQWDGACLPATSPHNALVALVA